MIKKLIAVQAALKAPKSQRNSFGGYNYRSAEDILEAVKPLLLEQGLLVTLSDTPVAVGERVYIRATATATDGDKTICAEAYAREPDQKKGADASQITGMASSYARKYALNGLFLIDDTKDADAMQPARPAQAARSTAPAAKQADPVKQAKALLWQAVKEYAAATNADPKALMEGVKKRPDAQLNDVVWLSKVAAEFAKKDAAAK